MPMTPEELRQFNDNFDFMLDYQKITQNALAEMGHELLPSSRTVQNIGRPGYCPRDSTARMIVDYFNATMPLRRNVSFEEFVSGPIDVSPFPKEIESYFGDYRLFYYSDNYDNPIRVHGGVLAIYGNRNRANCDLVMAIEEETNVRNVLDFLSIENIDRDGMQQTFNDFRDGLKETELSRRVKHIYYCHGTVSLTDKSLELDLENPNTPGYSMKILFPITDSDEYSIYKGGLGIYVSPASGHLGIRVCKIAAIRNEINKISLVDAEKKIGQYISMNLTNHKRFELSYRDSEQFRNTI